LKKTFGFFVKTLHDSNIGKNNPIKRNKRKEVPMIIKTTEQLVKDTSKVML